MSNVNNTGGQYVAVDDDFYSIINLSKLRDILY